MLVLKTWHISDEVIAHFVTWRVLLCSEVMKQQRSPQFPQHSFPDQTCYFHLKEHLCFPLEIFSRVHR